MGRHNQIENTGWAEVLRLTADGGNGGAGSCSGPISDSRYVIVIVAPRGATIRLRLKAGHYLYDELDIKTANIIAIAEFRSIYHLPSLAIEKLGYLNVSQSDLQGSRIRWSEIRGSWRPVGPI